MTNALKTGGAKELYRYGDVLVMQRYNELTARGMSPKDAIADINKYYATYQARSTIWGSRALAKVMGDTGLIWFGRFAQSKYNSLTNLGKDAYTAIKEKDPQAAREVAGRLAAMALMIGVHEYIKDKTGWGIGFGGNFTEVQAGIDFASDRSGNAFRRLVSTLATPAQVTNEGVDQYIGVDSFTQQPIAQGGGAQQLAGRLNHAATHLIGPVEQGAGVLSDWRKFALSPFGISPPNPTTDYFEKGGTTRQQGKDAQKQLGKMPGWEQTIINAFGG